jgi:hypothetical protein
MTEEILNHSSIIYIDIDITQFWSSEEADERYLNM